jgi:hypothetical protein
VRLCIFLVEKFDLYEWNYGQEYYKIYSSETKLEHICPTNSWKSERIEGKSVLQNRKIIVRLSELLKNIKNIFFF